MMRLKNFIRQIIFKYIKPPIVNNSNSQAGEDKIVAYLLFSMGIMEISYIDIGANDPVYGNNTYFFYLNKNRGILVEPDFNFHKRIKEIRPGDIVINAAISNEDIKNVNFFIFNEPSLNTLSKEEVNLRTRSGLFKVVQTLKISLVTIETVIRDYLNDKVPELISLDIEGIDFKVLNAFDFEKYPVPVWIVETCKYSENHIKPKAVQIIELMLSKGYFVYADTYINTIFVNKEWFYNYHAA